MASYASEAARKALEHGRAVFGFSRVISLIAPQNIRSIKVAERVGGRHEKEIEFLGKTLRVYAYDLAQA